MFVLDSRQLKELWDTGWLKIVRPQGGKRYIEGNMHKVKKDMYDKDAKAHVRVESIKDVGNNWEISLRRVSVFDYMKQRKPELEQVWIEF